MPSIDPNEIRRSRGLKIDAAEALRKAAETGKRALTDTQMIDFRKLIEESRELLSQAESLEELARLRATIGLPTEQRVGVIPIADEHAALPAAQWSDSNGRRVHVLGREHRFIDYVRATSRRPELNPDELSLGRLLRAMITKTWDGCELERRAMSESINSGGGVLVADELLGRFIDKARNKSVLSQAGMRVVPLSSDTCTIARVATDPSFAIKAENAVFSESDVAFDAVQMNPATVGCVMYASRELVEDSANFVQIVESVLAAAFAVQLDLLGLHGGATSRPNGIDSIAGVQGVDVSGALSYDKLHDALTKLQIANAAPSAWLLSPNQQNGLAKLLTGDGADSAAFPMPVPPALAEIPRFISNQVQDDVCYMGDFSTLLLGLRSGVEIEVSTTAGESFVRHQVAIKLSARVDFAAEHSNHLCRLYGITV